MDAGTSILRLIGAFLHSAAYVRRFPPGSALNLWDVATSKSAQAHHGA